MSDLNTELFTLCDQVIVSQEGKLSLIGLFTQIFVPHVPVHFPLIHSVAVVVGKPGSSHRLVLTIQDPRHQNIFTQATGLKLGLHGRANLISRIANISLPSTGTYTMTISSHSQIIATQPFEVIKTSPNKSSALPN